MNIADIKNYIRKLIVPENRLGILGIRYWQERILNHLLLAGAVLGFIVYIPSVSLSVKERLWGVAVADTIIYFYILVIFLNRRISYTVKAYSFCGISYLLGMILFTVLGPFGGGPVWLFSFPVLAALFVSLRAGLLAVLINAVTITAAGFLMMTGLLPWGSSVINPVEKWIVTSLNFMLMNIIVVISVSSILKGLLYSLENLRKSEKKYRRIFENIQDVYYEIDMEGTVMEISPSIEKVSGYSPEELLKRSFHDFYRTPEKMSEFIEKILEDGTVNDFEIELVDKSGSVHICSVNAGMTTYDSDRRVIVGIFRDITEQRKIAQSNIQLQKQLDLARKMEAIGLLAGGVAHDLNNILAAIVGYPDLIFLDMDEESPFREPIMEIKKSGQKASAIIQDLLTLSRRGVTTREVVDLNETIQSFLKSPECRKILSYNPESSIVSELKAERPSILGSSVHLSKTLINLITNAAEAQPEGGTITISTENVVIEKGEDRLCPLDTGEYIILTIHDEGTGIENQDLSRIFEPFFTKKRMGRSGTGLGMAVVWGTVQDHNGHIDVTSTPGSGTTFEIYFPVTSVKKKNETEKLLIESLMGNKEKILVVDDLKEQREIATAILEKLGYSVFSVESGEKAVEFLKIRNADLVMLDMIMEPGMDGLDTYKEIIEIKPEQKVLIASGFSETSRVKEMIALGAKKYIRKPYDLQSIAVAVKESLSTIGNQQDII